MQLLTRAVCVHQMKRQEAEQEASKTAEESKAELRLLQHQAVLLTQELTKAREAGGKDGPELQAALAQLNQERVRRCMLDSLMAEVWCTDWLGK